MLLAYTNIRVGDLERSIAFYRDTLDMRLHRRVDNETHRYSLAWLGFAPLGHGDAGGIELTFNWDTKHYDIGQGFGQFVIAVEDVYKTVEELRERGIVFTREPGPVQGGHGIIAFFEDPDGYRIELIESFTKDTPF